MSVNLLNHSVQQYSTNLELLLQERGPKLRGLVRTGSHVGKQAAPVNQIGSVVAQAPAGRFAELNRQDPSIERRWVFPTDRELNMLIDSFDELRLITDPQSMYAQDAAMAIGRAMDDAVIDAALGTATTGEQGGSSEAFDTTNFSVAANFGAASDVGLTVAKIIEARRLMRGAFVDIDNDPLTMVITSRQEADLLNQLEVVSTDFNAKPVLVDGRITRFLGVNIVISERVDEVSGDDACFMFAQSGMYLGVWKDITTRGSIRDDLSSQPMQVYTCATFGATRLEQGKVVRVLCNK